MTTLALDGGAPVRRAPFPPWPLFEDDEIAAVTRVLSSGCVNYWTGGECAAFEREFAVAVDRRHAISLANGTVALELALIGLNIGPGDEVIVPSRTFIATASSVVARGAVPVVADVDLESGNISAATIEAVLTPRTKAIIVVHLAGWPCCMDMITGLARERGLHVIEDCAQAHGAALNGRPVGSFGICAAFSFCQDKIMTTGGEGGMLVTDDEAIWRRAWEYKDHGKSWDAVNRADHPPGFRWLHAGFGTNWRMAEMQAAIGRRQLAKLPEWVSRRRRNAEILSAGIADLRGIRVPRPPAGYHHSYYKFYAYLQPAMLGESWNQARVIEAINAEGIPCMAGSCSEIYREQAFAAARLAPLRPLPVARRLGETSLVFLVHPTIEPADMEDAVRAIRKVMRAAELR